MRGSDAPEYPYENIALSLIPEAFAQKSLMEELVMDCENLRLCEDEILLMSFNERNDYEQKIETLTDSFALTDTEYQTLYSELDIIEEVASERLKSDARKLRCYLDRTQCLKYTKLEMFRDFTGYCDPTLFTAHVTGENFSSFGYALLFGREKQGLNAVEAVRRLDDLESCSCGFIDALDEEERNDAGNSELKKITVYPNPFAEQISIHLLFQNDQKVFVDIHDVSGKKITSLYDNTVLKGELFLEWNGKDSGGVRVSEGIYFCRVLSRDIDETVKFIVINKN